jgi:CheY-like chemotaxis protein
MATMHDSSPAPAKTVLVVEDDALVRLDLAEELRACGVAVIEAADAQQATRVLESEWRVDLAAWIWLRRPGVKVMLTSGHFNAGRSAGLEGDATFIAKPYNTGMVARRIVQDLAPH